MLDFESNPIIAAVRTDRELEAALNADLACIFLLSTSILTVAAAVSRAHENGKLLFVHIDFADGVGKDGAGVRYLAELGVDGINCTRPGIIAAAKRHGICAVQRFFMIDSRSVDTALESLRQVCPDMIEIMPGLACKSIDKIRKDTRIPIIAGGLIETKEEIFAALRAGASMISTGKRELWES